MRGRRFLLDWTVIDKKKKEENSYSHFGRLFWCSSLTLFISYPTPDRWFLNAFSSMRGITYEEVHAPDAKTTSQGEFFFSSFFMYGERNTRTSRILCKIP